MDAARRKELDETTRWDPGAVERRVFEGWLEGGHFHPPAEGTAAENFSIAIPPPNVTGALHMGHALNGTMQDVLARMRRMQGRNTLWVLGTDHASIAVHAVLEKELRSEGTSRQELGHDAFMERAWAWKADYGSQIVEQYERLGASCDYDRERFTLDEGYVKAVYRVFNALYGKGYIYRDNYMVNWDVGSRSVISDLEVENREVTDTLYEIDYPLEDSEGVITVATVRPETMLADTAVAVNPEDERHRELVGKHAVLPLVGRRLPIIADEHVDTEFGTGALKITPGHDVNDFEIGRAHGLEEISVIGEDGRMTEEAGEFAGITAAEAQEAVVTALRDKGLVRSEEEYTHSVPFSQRSGERIEPLISLQWFCRMDELAAPAIEVVESDRVRIRPEQWKRVYLDWMHNIRPWCISRQLWWGHQIPVAYCDACEEVYVFEEEPPDRCGACGGELRREEDVLDTWFSSALWPFATLGWPDTEDPLLKAFYPTDFLTTARDILFLWVARMVMMGLEFAGDIPFDDVYVHSVIQAPDGRRMSKSLGTGIDPLDEIEIHGADALRFGLLAMSSSQDVRYSADRVQQGRDLANKMWNASRLVLLNADVEQGRPHPDRPEDRWILSRLERTITAVSAKLEAYDFAHAALDLYEFFWSELCDWYLEMVKPRLYDGETEVGENLVFVLERVLALAHPMLPFVTEEIWSYLPGAERRGQLVVARFPEANDALIDAGAEGRIEAAIELTRDVRRWRDLVGVAAGSVLPARAASDGEGDTLELAARLARLELGDGEGDALTAIGDLEILASEEIDADEVGRRIGGRRDELRAEVERAERKLANEGFVAKAPPAVVEEERAKLEAYRAELSELSGAGRLMPAGGEPRGGSEAVRGDFAAEEWLRGLEAVGWRFGLERMQLLLAQLGMPQRRYASIHVVGTNGKSSVTTLTAALLERTERATGAYLSPHRDRWAERIQIGGAEIRPGELAAAVERVAHSVPAVERDLPEGDVVTQFEAATAAAFVAFAAAGVEVAVVEAGLGGRLDATNVLPSRVTALPSIGLDHTEYLGETELEIAAEKLAVLQEGSVLVMGAVSPAVEDLARRTAEERHAAVVDASEPVSTPALSGRAPYLAHNLAVAVAAAEQIAGPLDRSVIDAVASATPLPGRMEVTTGIPPLVLDAAHNPDGARAVADALPGIAQGRPVIACLAVLSDKDAEGIIAPLAPLLETAVCTEVPASSLAGSGRSGSGSVPARELAGLLHAAGVEDIEILLQPRFALARVKELARQRGGVALAAGSHYLLGYGS